MLWCRCGEWYSALSIGVSDGALHAAGASEPSLQAQGDALVKNVEDMVAHGGMGDTKAIVHHCHEAAHYAEKLLAAVPQADSRRLAAANPLNRVMNNVVVWPISGRMPTRAPCSIPLSRPVPPRWNPSRS